MTVLWFNSLWIWSEDEDADGFLCLAEEDGSGRYLYK